MIHRHPLHLLFVYGSLMNAQSRERTLGRPVRAVRASLAPAAEYHLRWCFHSSEHSMTSLGIYRDSDCRSIWIPGMVLWVTDADLQKLDKREKGYTRTVLNGKHVVEEDAQRSWMRTESVFTYVVDAPARPCRAFPITARYLSLCAERVESE